MGLRDKLSKLKDDVRDKAIQGATPPIPPEPKKPLIPQTVKAPVLLTTPFNTPPIPKEKQPSKGSSQSVAAMGKIGKRIGELKGLHLVRRDGEGRIIVDIKSNVTPSQIVLHLYKLQSSEVLVINLPISKGRH